MLEWGWPINLGVSFNRAPPSTGSQPPLSLQPPILGPRYCTPPVLVTCDPPPLSLPPYFGPNGAGYYHPRQGILKHQISSTSSSQVERCSISVFIRWMCPLPPAPFNQSKSFHLFWPVLILNDFTQILMQHCISTQGMSMKQTKFSISHFSCGFFFCSILKTRLSFLTNLNSTLDAGDVEDHFERQRGKRIWVAAWSYLPFTCNHPHRRYHHNQKNLSLKPPLCQWSKES